MWSDAGDRYRTAVADIYSAENKLKLQLRIESTLAKVQAKLGMISAEEADQITAATSRVKLARVKEIEKEIHHDLMAVVRALAEQAGEAGEKVHLGATSNDIQDTTLALQLQETKTLLLDQLDLVSAELYRKAKEFKSVPSIGRTHGQFAVPTTMGFKFANFLYELQLAKQQLHSADISLSKFSGAIGNYASTHRMDIEKELFAALGLEPTAISTQVVSRVVLGTFMNAMALCASVLERISKEIRNLQRSEIKEWFEPFSSKQVGSSAMPHKRNPHKSERVSGLSRIIRGNVGVALENIALEHERDISHSSVERIILPESANLLLFIATQMTAILTGLVVNLQGIQQNLSKAAGVSKSEQILKRLVDKVGRQEGHELLRVHLHAEDYAEAVMDDQHITQYISKEELQEIFNDIDTGLAEEKTTQVVNLYDTVWKNYRN